MATIARRHFPRWHAWILLTLRAGLRLGEQIGLQWNDIDWNGQFLLVQRNLVRGVLTPPKSHQCRRVDMSTQLTTALREWRAVQQARWLKKGEDMWHAGEILVRSSKRLPQDRLPLVAEVGEALAIYIGRDRPRDPTRRVFLCMKAPRRGFAHGSIPITVDTYGHLIPGANRGAVDRLDDASPMQPSATQAQPEALEDDIETIEDVDLLGKSGEPHFRELEPARRVAAAGGGASGRGLSRRDGRSNLP